MTAIVNAALVHSDHGRLALHAQHLARLNRADGGEPHHRYVPSEYARHISGSDVSAYSFAQSGEQVNLDEPSRSLMLRQTWRGTYGCTLLLGRIACLHRLRPLTHEIAKKQSTLTCP